MLKKLLTVGAMTCALFIGGTTMAQNNDGKVYAKEYPHYGFWSNWSIGGQIGYTHQFENGMAWKEGSNAGFQLMLEKELNHVWSMRIRGGMPGVFQNDSTTADSLQYDRYGKMMVDFKFSINNAIKGYDPDRKGSLYLFAGFGAWINRHEIANNNHSKTLLDQGNFGLAAEGGLGWSYRICEHSSIFLEAGLDIISDVPSFIKKGGFHHTNLFAGVGYMYNFGPTAADRELIAQKALLTQESFDALNNRIANLESELTQSKQAEQRLQNRINQLENELAEMAANAGTGNQAETDSLRNIIENMKADQYNYYALPFSITYDVNEYKISEDQNDKIAAIAKVLKANENAKFAIVGFCDHTGSDAYNMKLSQRRAEEVKRVLVKKYGIDEDRLSCEWKGKSMPFGDIKLPINRRVSFYRVIE